MTLAPLIIMEGANTVDRDVVRLVFTRAVDKNRRLPFYFRSDVFSSTGFRVMMTYENSVGLEAWRFES